VARYRAEFRFYEELNDFLPPDRRKRTIEHRFDLAARVRPLARCARCNGRIGPVSRAEVTSGLPPGTLRTQRVFRRCRSCGRVYWRGAHDERLSRQLALAAGDGGPGTPSTGRPAGWA
jgi:uncharacterized protein with PIN domain